MPEPKKKELTLSQTNSASDPNLPNDDFGVIDRSASRRKNSRSLLGYQEEAKAAEKFSLGSDGSGSN